MKLVILHYHLRPGGIRRVIELAAPHIVREFGGRVTRLTLASGEPPDSKWKGIFLKALRPMPVEFFIEPAFSYFSGQRRSPTAIRAQVRHGLEQLFEGEPRKACVVWAHNLGLARNLILTQELVRACQQRNIPLLAHHHDWWFDNRWQRWPEIRRAGFRTLASAANAVFGWARTRHIAINRADWDVLKKHFHSNAIWLPNPADRIPCPNAPRVRKAWHWLQSKLDHDHAPVWILPCRLLRRKNVAEALLLKRWLRPEAWLVTTGDVTSAEEEVYFQKLNAAARMHHWRIRLGVLAGDESQKPSITELLAASEAVLLTSIQEGFGLPFLEAAAAGRPLIARNLPNIVSDLEQFGFIFPQNYDDIFVHPSLFDWHGERQRQQRFYTRWNSLLPQAARRWTCKPALLAAGDEPKPVPFSRLTLTAQIEVLTKPVSESWELCAPLNPFLIEWRRRAQNCKLRVTPWPRSAERWLSGRAYAHRFREALETDVKRTNGRNAPVKAQADFIRLKLASRYLYPLLWSSDT